MNDKINVLKMVDDKLDKAVKIQGTNFAGADVAVAVVLYR